MTKIPAPFSSLLNGLLLVLFLPTLNANGQQLTPDHASIAFGNVQLGTSSRAETLTNKSATKVTISANSVTGIGFSLAGLSLPKTLNVGESTSFTVTFAPTIAGAASGNINITFDTGILSIPLSGTGVTQGSLSPNPSSVMFGNVRVGTREKDVTLRNSGGASVSISAISITDPAFTFAGPSLPIAVGPGDTATLTVTFAPRADSKATGNLAITSNGANPHLDIPLSGSNLEGSLTVDLDSISFGDTGLQTPRTQTERLRNGSETSLTISAASVSGNGFSVSDPLLPLTLGAGKEKSVILDAGQSIVFTVTFTPASFGFESGKLDITTSNGNLSVPLSGTGVYSESQIKKLPECSLAKTNNECKLVVDRANPISPSTVQMYSKDALIVVVKNPKRYERYFLDYQTGQATLTPDVASSIVQGLVPSLNKVNALLTADYYILPGGAAPSGAPDPCSAAQLTTDSLPTANHVIDVVSAFQKCFGSLGNNAIYIYGELEPILAPDSLTPASTPPELDLDVVQGDITNFLNTEIAISSRITNIAAITNIKNTDGAAILQLTNLQKSADSVAADLTSYSQRITDYWTFDNKFHDCKNLIDVDDATKCIWIASRTDDDTVYNRTVTRTVTYSLNTLNLISNSQQAAVDPTKKKTIASIAINFADSPSSKTSAFRWEASAGVFFSTLPVRSFPVVPIFTSGVVTNKVIGQNVLHPTVVPFAAGNYRITNDLPWGRWKTNLYWTGAIGINPNTVTADFATGLSLSWRALMVSALCHFGHDVRLTQGLYVGESLGAGFNGSVPTQTHWTESFAIGLSVRVPSLVGR